MKYVQIDRRARLITSAGEGCQTAYRSPSRRTTTSSRRAFVKAKRAGTAKQLAKPDLAHVSAHLRAVDRFPDRPAGGALDPAGNRQAGGVVLVGPLRAVALRRSE
jgi:hypothetical protein